MRCRVGGVVARSAEPVYVLLRQLFLLSRFREENFFSGRDRKLSVVRWSCGTDPTCRTPTLPQHQLQG